MSGPPEQTARHAFISYRRNDAWVVDELIRVLGSRYTLWRDTTKIRGGQLWREQIARAIDSAYALILVVSSDTERSKEVYAEFFYAQGHGVAVIPILIAECELPFGLENINARLWYQDRRQALEALRHDLEFYQAQAPSAEPSRAVDTYLGALKLASLMSVENYIPMAGVARHRPRQALRQPHTVTMRPDFSLRRSSPLIKKQKQKPEEVAEEVAEEAVQSYDNLLPALHKLERVLVLGEPGSGKTTTLYKFADELRQAVLKDSEAPLPVIVPLREWLGDRSWKTFVTHHLGTLAPHYDELLTRRRLYLLMDGLNEIPRDEYRPGKIDALRQLLTTGIQSVVTCRELDYRDAALKLDKDTDMGMINIHPLDPKRILDFLSAYLVDALDQVQGAAKAEHLFWQIAGGAEIKSLWEEWHNAGVSLQDFFTASDIPAAVRWAVDNRAWHRVVKSPRNLMPLAANPYLLWMFLSIYLEVGAIPRNRGALFDEFVFQLLKRERLTEGEAPNQEGKQLIENLGELAWVLQTQVVSPKKLGSGVELTLPRVDASKLLREEERLYRAASANLLEDAEPVRFTHQLLQEYFTAQRLLVEIEKGYKAEQLWPVDRWWEPSGWEEAAVLAVGMSGEKTSAVIDWLLPANPEVVAQCIQRSGVQFDDPIKLKLLKKWLPCLTNVDHYPQAAARAAIGRALGSVSLENGQSLDDRHGVGLTAKGIPDIDWVAIPGGKVKLEAGWLKHRVKPFLIARYPVTNIQFQAFVDAEDGYGNEKWWADLGRTDLPRPPYWSEANHPQESVSWYEAVAFCRWLSTRLGYDVRLPTEWEWQQAATGGDPSNVYPWGPDWEAACCNSVESGLRRTTAVGMYPKGSTPQGVLDMAGNVWEWCANRYGKIIDRRRRVIRGGSWINGPRSLRSAARDRLYPEGGYDDVGFRLAQDLN